MANQFNATLCRQRKELLHAQLHTEVIDQLKHRFKPDVNLIKKRISILIDREYLERVDEAGKNNRYVYLA
jgi:cullin 3